MSNIKTKVKKLLALATDGRGNEQEMETALRMAEKMMLAHNISVSDLEWVSGEKVKYGWKTVVIATGEKSKPRRETCAVWTGILAAGVATFTDCKAEWTDERLYGKCMKFSGEENDIEYAAWLFKRLRDVGYLEASKFRGKENDAFRKGYATRLSNRMRKLRRDRDIDLNAAKTGIGTALVIVNQKIALRDEQFGKPSYRRSDIGSKRASLGFQLGTDAANKVGFNRPIGDTTEKKRIGTRVPTKRIPA